MGEPPSNRSPRSRTARTMKWIALLALGGGLTAMAAQHYWPCDCMGASDAESSVEVSTAGLVRGWFLEARDLSVFAGACHVNGEADAQGQSAVCAWSLEGGEVDGMTVVAAIEGEDNLAHGGQRKSKLFLPEESTERQRRVVQDWLEAEHGATLGSIAGVEVTDLVFEREGDRFRLRAGEAVEISGLAVADGSCCSMKEQRWYEPLAGPHGAIVANPDTCRVDPGEGFTRWSYADANSAFFTEVEVDLGCASASCSALDMADLSFGDGGCGDEGCCDGGAAIASPAAAAASASCCEDKAAACEGQALVPTDACCSSVSRATLLN
jgi:hypothetical protein